MSYHDDPEADRLAVEYRDACGERTAKKAEDTYGKRLAALGLNRIEVARAMRALVRGDVVAPSRSTSSATATRAPWGPRSWASCAGRSGGNDPYNRRMPKKKDDKSVRQRAHRQRLIDEGGRVLLVELSATAAAALEYIRLRDDVTNRGAIEQSLILNAGTKAKK